MSRLTRAGRPNLSRETKFSGVIGDMGKFFFPVQLTTRRICNLTRTKTDERIAIRAVHYQAFFFTHNPDNEFALHTSETTPPLLSTVAPLGQLSISFRTTHHSQRSSYSPPTMSCFFTGIFGKKRAGAPVKKNGPESTQQSIESRGDLKLKTLWVK